MVYARSPARSDTVLAGFDPAIHGVRPPPDAGIEFRRSKTLPRRAVDGRVKPGHDGGNWRGRKVASCTLS